MIVSQAWLGQPDVADKVYEAIVKYNLPVQSNIEVSSYYLRNRKHVPCFYRVIET